ncbi:hypothetical protein BCR39DRAFT_590166 [Naematelia encephala]|uniref:Phytanoyl-CoA dioxygenase n=1 Tax=Naematelia encephala TaxID=71784 RepID=A0A1Y2ATE0_9TREE|nr:hypothetical protein BCR39DRAFT_590166 [Naematelia encephala]
MSFLKTRPSVQTIPATSPIEEILRILHRDGAIVLSDYCTDEEVDALNAKANVHFERTEKEGRGEDSFFKNFRASHTTAAYDLIGAAPEERKVWHQGKVFVHESADPTSVMEEFLCHEVWDWLGEERVTRKTGYWLHTSIAYKVGPGAGEQVLHRDINSAAIQRTGPESLTNGVSTFVAGCNVTAENGGTHVAPGSLAIWLSNIFHGAGANTLDPSHPDALRIIYGFFACGDNFRQGEITALACKPEEFQKMPPEILRLLGFYRGKSGGGALAGRDPIDSWEGLKGYRGGEWLVNDA